MKKRNHIFLIIAMLIMSSGCENSKFLDYAPDDMLTLEKVFNDVKRVEEWQANVYAGIPDPYWDNMRGHELDPFSDDACPNPAWQQYGWEVIGKQIGNWGPTANNGPVYIDGLAKKIRQAYVFIENVHPIGGELSAERVQYMKQECRFLIAYYYSLMAMHYGGVPLLKGKVPVDAPIEELMKEQAPFDEVVDFVDAELSQLATVLPDKVSNMSREYGRATKPMALAVRARLLIFAASPLVNGNADYVNHKNINGVNIFNSTYDAQKWVKAMTASRELIQYAESSGLFELYVEKNAKGEIDPFESLINLWTTKADANKEILFGKAAPNLWEFGKHVLPRGTAGGNGGLGVTQSLVDAFYTKDGLPITESRIYSEKGFSTQDEVRDGTKYSLTDPAKPGVITQEGTYAMYCNREPRFYTAVMYNEMYYRNTTKRMNFYINQPDGGPTHDSPAAGYLLRKKTHPNFDVRNGVNPYRPGIVYRLGEVYLNYVEALNEVEPSNPDILKYLNKIRERAGVPIYGSQLGQISPPAGKDAMRLAIQRERRVELALEGIRIHDIRRWKMGEQLLNKDFYGMNVSGSERSDDPTNAKAYFVRKVYQKRVFKKQHYFWPIPQWEIDRNPRLVQSPFWND